MQLRVVRSDIIPSFSLNVSPSNEFSIGSDSPTAESVSSSINAVIGFSIGHHF